MGMIPDGWNDYIRHGSRINKTRFIAFKVPLREGPNLKCNITEDNKWYPKLLVTLIPEIGIVIDLTNTSKYYSPQDFLQLNVDHAKIFVQGHHIPSKENYKKFRNAVRKFLLDNKDNDKLIGVHCTHGLNRTGFLVCRYMIEEMKMSADEAISLFEEARGHKIKRENYINELHSLAQTKSASPDSDSNSNDPVPQVPDRRGSKSGSRRPYPQSRPQSSRISPSSQSRHNPRPPPRTFYSDNIEWHHNNRHTGPLPHALQNGNWRNPNHEYVPARQPRFNAIPNRLNRGQRDDHGEPHHPSHRPERHGPRDPNRQERHGPSGPNRPERHRSRDAHHPFNRPERPEQREPHCSANPSEHGDSSRYRWRRV